MAKPEDYLVGIDIGSSKIGVLIGLRDAETGIEVVGKGVAPNRGTRKGQYRQCRSHCRRAEAS